MTCWDPSGLVIVVTVFLTLLPSLSTITVLTLFSVPCDLGLLIIVFLVLIEDSKNLEGETFWSKNSSSTSKNLSSKKGSFSSIKATGSLPLLNRSKTFSASKREKLEKLKRLLENFITPSKPCSLYTDLKRWFDKTS